jgi:hypothetical protein
MVQRKTGMVFLLNILLDSFALFCFSQVEKDVKHSHWAEGILYCATTILSYVGIVLF